MFPLFLNSSLTLCKDIEARNWFNWVLSQMGRRKKIGLSLDEAMEFLNHIIQEKSLIPFDPSNIDCLAIERWVFSSSKCVPLIVAVWATMQVPSLELFKCTAIFLFLLNSGEFGLIIFYVLIIFYNKL